MTRLRVILANRIHLTCSVFKQGTSRLTRQLFAQLAVTGFRSTFCLRRGFYLGCTLHYITKQELKIQFERRSTQSAIHSWHDCVAQFEHTKIVFYGRNWRSSYPAALPWCSVHEGPIRLM